MIRWNIVEYRLIPFSNQTCSAGKYSITGHVNGKIMKQNDGFPLSAMFGDQKLSQKMSLVNGRMIYSLLCGRVVICHDNHDSDHSDTHNNSTKRMDLEEYMVHGQSQVGYP